MDAVPGTLKGELMNMHERELTPKQRAFVAEYLVDLNATQAAIRAGYSVKTAKQTACENLAKPDVQAAIAELMKAREGRTEVTQDKVIADIRRVGKAAEDAEQYSPALRALELLGRHLGMFKDKVQLGGDPDAPPVRIEATMTPAEAYMRMLGKG